MKNSKEEMVAMLAEKYEQAVRNSELVEAEKKGEAQGKARGDVRTPNVGEGRGN